MTTKEDIREWLKRANKKEDTHMLVVCDSFDYEDYPVYIKRGDDILKVIKETCTPDNMQRLMEVYNLSMDLEEQLNTKRVFNY